MASGRLLACNDVLRDIVAELESCIPQRSKILQTGLRGLKLFLKDPSRRRKLTRLAKCTDDLQLSLLALSLYPSYHCRPADRRESTAYESEESRLERTAMKQERDLQAEERLAAHAERIAQGKAREDSKRSEADRRRDESSSIKP